MQAQAQKQATLPGPARPPATSWRGGGPALAGELLDLQRHAGNAAVAQMMVQRAIATDTESVTATRMDGVTALTAVIGARIIGGRGTNPAAGEPTRINQVGPIKGRYVGGHMLNQEMGGLGTWNNMIVQSEDSNKKMNLHDNVIKRLSDRARLIETYYRTGYEYGVRETITVNAPAPDGTHHHAGEQSVPASLSVTLNPVMRPAGTTSSPTQAWPAGGTHGHAEAINNPYTVVNVPPYPAAVVGTGTAGIAARLKAQARKQRAANASALSGMKAKRLRSRDFRSFSGIGKVRSKALRAFFKANPVSLNTALTMNLTGTKFTRADLNLLLSHRLK